MKPRPSEVDAADAAARRAARRPGSSDDEWRTALTCIEPNKILLRGYPLDEVMGRLTFGETIYLLLVGEIPTPSMGRLMEALLVSFIDHGATPPSTLAARNTATTGAPLRACVAAGIGVPDAITAGISRAACSFSTAGSRWCAKAWACAKRPSGSFRNVSTPTSIRLASATATTRETRAPRDSFRTIADALFIISRVPGIAAHADEERQRQQPMRQIDPKDHRYDGPSVRRLPERRK